MFHSVPKPIRRRWIVPAAALLLAAPAVAALAQGSPPTITTLGKSEYCSLGDLLTLNGAGFGAQGDHGYVTVRVPVTDASGTTTYPEFPLSIKDWSDSEIQARLFMPNGAGSGSWIAIVHRDDGQTASVAFTAVPCSAQAEDQANPGAHQPLPVVYDFQKSEFQPGDRLIIHGDNFNLDQDSGFVTLIGLFANGAAPPFYREFTVPVALWTSNQIQVSLLLPAGAQPGIWVATVHRSDGETASQAFTLVTSPPAPSATAAGQPVSSSDDCLEAGDPVVEGFQKPAFCAGGDLLILHGEHFCNVPDGGWVTITAPFQDAQGNVTYQEFPASVIAWLSTQIQIQFQAPSGAVPGTYLATVHVFRDNGSGNSVVKTASGSFTVVECSPP